MCLGLATSWESWSLKLCVLIDFGILSVLLPFLTYIWRNHYNIYHYMLKHSSEFLMFATCQKIQSRKPSEDNGRCWNETKACRRHVLNQLHQTFMVITMKLQVLKAENGVILTEKNSLGQLWARTCSIHFARRSRCLHQGPVSFWKNYWSWLQNSESTYIIVRCPWQLVVKFVLESRIFSSFTCCFWEAYFSRFFKGKTSSSRIIELENFYDIRLPSI